MKIYPIEGLKFKVAEGDKPFEDKDGLTLVFPDEAEKELDQFLSKYAIDIEFTWYFSDLDSDVWACICFAEEQDIAGHLVQSRTNISQVGFKPYLKMPDPEKDFIPKVGSMFISSKLACEDLSHKSDLFLEVWNQLKDCDRGSRWLLIMEEIPETIRGIPKSENDRLWLKNRSL